MTLSKRTIGAVSLACLLAAPAFAGDTRIPRRGHDEVLPAAPGGPFSAAQLAEMQARVELANAIVRMAGRADMSIRAAPR